MKKLRGFRLGHRLVKVAFRWILRPPRRRHVSRLFSFIRRAKRLCCPYRGKIRLGRDIASEKETVPKGYTVMYVGEPDGGTCSRVVVPVAYLNHPLFGELLRESERVYGFHHAGGITIPCGVAEFEKIQMRIAAWGHGRRSQLRMQ